MLNPDSLASFARAVETRDAQAAVALLSRYPNLFEGRRVGIDYFLSSASKRDDVAMMQVLVEFGANIHAPLGYGVPPSPETVVERAAGAGSINVVKWLLARGAKLNHEVEGNIRCLTLTSAVTEGHFDVVKLLIEHGASLNAVWAGNNALSFAIRYGHSQIEAYLRSQGALEPWQMEGTLAGASDILTRHIAEHFGKPEPLALQYIIPGDPQVRILAIKRPEGTLLVTHGMSSLPMTVPPGQEAHQYGELSLLLPPGWPTDAESLRDFDALWPLQWMLNIAHYPHRHRTWLGADHTIISNGEPPELLARMTPMTCWLLRVLVGTSEIVPLGEGKVIHIYALTPIYTSERDYEKRHGIAPLVALLERNHVGRVVMPERPPVV